MATEADDAGVAVIKGRVVNDLGIGPGLAVIAAFADGGASPGADMLETQAGGDGAEGAVVLAGDAGPAEIAELFLGQGTNDAMADDGYRAV